MIRSLLYHNFFFIITQIYLIFMIFIGGSGNKTAHVIAQEDLSQDEDGFWRSSSVGRSSRCRRLSPSWPTIELLISLWRTVGICHSKAPFFVLIALYSVLLMFFFSSSRRKSHGWGFPFRVFFLTVLFTLFNYQ